MSRVVNVVKIAVGAGLYKDEQTAKGQMSRLFTKEYGLKDKLYLAPEKDMKEIVRKLSENEGSKAREAAEKLIKSWDKVIAGIEGLEEGSVSPKKVNAFAFTKKVAEIRELIRTATAETALTALATIDEMIEECEE